MNVPRRIGVLTSGGDCAGLNAVIRAVTDAATLRGWQVLGVLDGSVGLFEQPRRYVELNPDALDGPAFRSGGTLLGTVSSGDPFRFPMPDGSLADRSAEFTAGVRELGIDALVVIGGDGSMRIMSRLCAQAGLPMLGIPKTIDNDVPGTDTAVGFATAVGVVSDALDRLLPTAASHHRVIVVETMGRDAGHIALHGGIAGGADLIVLPELGFEMEAIIAHLHEVFARGRRHALLVVAEGAARAPAAAQRPPYESIGGWLARQIEAQSGVQARCTVLGHLQRGGPPSAEDRLLASAFGVHAVELLAQQQHDRVVVQRGGRIDDVPLATATCGPRRVSADDPLLGVAAGLGISFGTRRTLRS
ncbi:ATP-dependent 6-phosphofructokinase [Solimonas flava]|uniref:ATP-dependent 6-phosphofructokinase n=1 Tax=Solimonas flava TaxID=415849 RepID=UPI00040FF419|nr:ATP-dependent 6-phosphofructokinase [Solimonas flava]